ncbi:MIT domain-containing protein 1-like [Amphiura filiformis]|uniref:MIT domain-containing protein 1-like n=1 Tax=Amphiura filiformis TaxID=82378 RepID=UPI003B21541A
MASTSGIEASAISVLKRAVELDTKGRYTESLICYQEGLQLLMDALKGTTDEAKRLAFRQRISEYMNRAEKLKNHVEKEKETGKYHEQMHIANNSTGHSYQKVFGHFLDEMLTEVHVEDPYIRQGHQIYNFLRFCELLVVSSCPVKRIILTTGVEENNFAAQQTHLNEIKTSLSEHGIQFDIEFSKSLHDREIRFNNGWIIKIGRGLDYYKPTGKFSIGYCDMNLRKCHETTVDVFHSKFTKTR